MKVTVFYEDSPGVAVTHYGPHLLALACVADRMNLERYTLRQHAEAVPMKGDSKLREVLQGIGGRHVIALFDSDHVRDLYGLKATATREEVIAKVKSEAGPDVEVHLLERNMEDLIRHCCEAARSHVPDGKPRPEERDSILHRTAAAPQSVRDAVRAACPSFDQFVEALQRGIESVRVRSPE